MSSDCEQRERESSTRRRYYPECCTTQANKHQAANERQCGQMKRWSELCDRLSVEKQRWFRNEHPRSPPQPVRRKQRFDDPASLPRVRATGSFGTWISTAQSRPARSIRKRSRDTWWARRVSPPALSLLFFFTGARGYQTLLARALSLPRLLVPGSVPVQFATLSVRRFLLGSNQ